MDKSKGAPFQCALCPGRKPYASNSSLRRHCREKHEPGFECPQPGCDDYEWTASRRYLYIEHLKNHGLGDDKIGTILAQPPRPRVIESNLPAPHFSLPPIDDRQSLAEPRQRPPMPTLLDVGNNANHAIPPLIPSVAYNRWFRHAEPTELKLLAPTLAPSGLLSKEDSALVNGHFITHGQFRFVHAFFYTRYI